jgi:hypothetical protein
VAGSVLPGPTASSVAASPVPAVAPAADAPLRYEIRLTVEAETREKLEMARDLLSHSVPDGDLAQVFDRALTALIEDLVRMKFAVTDRPRKGNDASTARRPAAVRRTVFIRDRGRCTQVSPDGRRCEERRFLQFDHIKPQAEGGAFTVDNIRLRCGPHNRLDAERYFGFRPPGSEPPVPGRVAAGRPLAPSSSSGRLPTSGAPSASPASST